MGWLSGWLTGQRHRKRDFLAAKLISQSSLFESRWYLQTYPDVADSGTDPALHYLDSGWREGRDPGPHFSTNAYLRANVDVARSGANPLLHFLEFGYSEGRGTWDHRPGSRPVTSPGEPFGEAAPCVNLSVPDDPPVRWVRAVQLGQADGILSVDGLPVGYIRHPAERAAIENSFAWLAGFSGYPREDVVKFGEVDAIDPPCSLLDSWYLDQSRLRTRWLPSSGPMVVRVFQHDPFCSGTLMMVGEGLATTSLDFVDVSLWNPYFPLLFVLAEPDGRLLGTRPLPFPSLCRGGLHYPELLALARGDRGSAPIDIVGQGQLLSERLISIVRGAAPLVESMRVDLSGVDGTEPLFQPDFRMWLDQIAGISIGEDGPDAAESGQSFLAAAVGLRSRRSFRPGGGTLVLAADMVPTLSVLCAAGGAIGKSRRDTLLSLIVAEADVSQPATLFELPPTDSAPFQAPVPGVRSAWPRLIGKSRKSDGQLVGAIRRRRTRDLTDAELFVPVSGPEPIGSQEPEPITWLIWPEDWDDDVLEQALEALSLSSGAGSQRIALIGNSDAAISDLADRLFPGRTRSYERAEFAADDAETSLVGYLGSGVILHDKRCPRLLSSLMRHDGVATASCAIVSTEARGKTFRTSVIDAGKLAAPSMDAATIQVGEGEAGRLWRTVYSVARPPRDLWIARFSSLPEWLRSGLRPQDLSGQHLCTTLVTASALPREGHRTTRIRPPALKDGALQSEALYG
ncbi:MAG TPA: hypothetical protein VFH89_14875 [Sphingomicrobium sp.]|nr:hypothetical protein [Sphingomicrobium sp.]